MKEQTDKQLTHWMKIAIEVGIILFAVGVAWTTLRGVTERNTKDIVKHDQRLTHVERNQSEVNADIREIRVKQKYISKGIDEIKEKLQ
ncbi:hypothetical protein LCGC14_1968020 [marine sediment metagenome]|uniref:Uncharacterized protein n=1 Tax=marine sediment metagenome TaxID=412755 RepID=A0A0F9HR09_9ZZZZ